MKTDMCKTALGLLPENIRVCCEKITDASSEELRLRIGKSVSVLTGGKEQESYSPKVTEEDLNRILEKATGASLHAFYDTLKNGFVTYKGIRIGICGDALTKNGEIYTFSRFTSLNIRIPHPFSGKLMSEAKEIGMKRANTLIVSPPGMGKTTALRELVRLISNDGYRVSVADDRCELFPKCEEGEIFECGRCTDVLSGAGKECAALMMLRTMNPQFIALDEISKRDEMNAVREIFGCGVSIISTAHGADIDEMKKRPVYRELIEEGIFSHVLKITLENSARVYGLKAI